MVLNPFLLLVPIATAALAIVELLDLRRRDVPSANVKQLLALLTVFPPLLGGFVYYWVVIRPNRFARHTQ